MFNKIKAWKRKHPDLYEFILFNVMSNIATITNFLVLWVSEGFLFRGLSNIDFHFFIFRYPAGSGGLGGFLAFLLAYVLAQIVNFIVQRKVVFNATVSIRKVMPLYILTVTVAGMLSVWLPPHVIIFLKPFAGSLAPTLANVANIILQVVINYPMLKFVIMKKEPQTVQTL